MNQLSERITNNKLISIVFVLTVIIQLILAYIFAYKGIVVVVGILLSLSFMLFTLFSVKKMFYILIFYILVFEEYYYASSFSNIPIYYIWPIAMSLFLILIIYWMIHLTQNKYNFQLNKLDLSIIAFLIIVFISAVNGYLRGYDGSSWRWDVLPYFFYLSYFIILYSPLNNNRSRMFDYVLLLSVLIGIEMIYALSQLKGAIIFRRVVTQNIHIIQFGLPYAGLTAIYSLSRYRRLVGAILIPFFLIAVIISQQRALLFTIVLTLSILAIIFLKNKYQVIKINKKKFLTIIAAITVIFGVSFVILESLTKESLLLTFISRFYVFFNPVNFSRDPSWQIRWQEIIRVWPQIQKNIIFGAGLGATTISRHRYILQITVDNSYVYTLWKHGIFGLIFLLSIHYFVIQRCIAVLKKTIHNSEKIISLTLILNTIGLLLVGITNASIAHYRFIFIWLAFAAYIEIIARKYDKIS